MKNEKPILFSTPMVQAVLTGTKTQTRRVVKPQPHIDSNGDFCWKNINFGQDSKGPCVQSIASSIPYRVLGTNKTGIHNPYGKVGDELWVRETFFPTNHGYSLYKADFAPVCGQMSLGKDDEGKHVMVKVSDYKWKPSIHMPREASRIQLRITDIRVERLQDISEEDAIAEGIKELQGGGYKDYLISTKNIDAGVDESSSSPAKESFRSLWDSINGEPRKDGQDISWKSNPWVWVVEFEVIDQ